MKPGLYYYEPKDVLFEVDVYDTTYGCYDIRYFDPLTGGIITLMDQELNEEVIENSVYLGEV